MGYAIVGRRFNTWQDLLEWALKYKSVKLEIKKPKPHGFEIRLKSCDMREGESLLVVAYPDSVKPEQAVKDSLPKIMQLLGIDYI